MMFLISAAIAKEAWFCNLKRVVQLNSVIAPYHGRQGERYLPLAAESGRIPGAATTEGVVGWQVQKLDRGGA